VTSLVVKRSQPLSGVENVSLTSGDGTAAVVFEPDISFGLPPSVLVSFAESLGAGKRGFCSADSITASGFTITVDSDSALTDVDVSWIAVFRRSSEEASQ
jgi:hypothetical protein